MPTIVVPIRVKIGLRSNGHADHPDWTSLPLAQEPGPGDAEAKVRAHQIVKWKYDKTSGHEDDTPESPRGMQFGMMCVSEQFVTEAEAAFPTLVTRMTEAEAEDFWDNKAHAHLDELRRNIELLNGLKLELDLLIAAGSMPAARITALKDKIRNAIDPDHIEPGLKRNEMKRWATAKGALGITVAL